MPRGSLPHERGALCSCRVTGPDYEQTRIDKACPYHGDNGTMIAKVKVGSSRGSC